MASKTNPQYLLATLITKTQILYQSPNGPTPALFMDRAQAYMDLKYHDLAAADAYRAIDLTEKLSELSEDEDSSDSSTDGSGPMQLMYYILSLNLTLCGCTKEAWDFLQTGLQIKDVDRDGEEGAHSSDFSYVRKLLNNECYKLMCAAKRFTDPISSEPYHDHVNYIKAENLKSVGWARREVYTWNDHEPERSSPSALRELNEKLAKCAPKCEVRSVELPKMHMSKDRLPAAHSDETLTQLGLFANEDIAPGETVLQEFSVLTATNRADSSLCDACQGPLPDVDTDHPACQCEDCFDTVYCSERCRSAANEKYHPAICGQDGLNCIGIDQTTTLEADDNLYLKLVARVIAMAETQNMHPLDLPDVMYLWGDFDFYLGHPEYPIVADPKRDLPFSFKNHIMQPMRILEEMDLDPFQTLPKYDTWVVNTLYAKFRAVASARQSTWDGTSEVSVVHPMWCLANHSCDPNVEWDCAGDMKFIARKTMVQWGERNEKECEGGIKVGEQIYNHYCDVRLGLKDRREYAEGPLGGECQCERCSWEEQLKDKRNGHR